MNYVELIENLERLQGPDREVDELIWCVDIPLMVDILPHWSGETREDAVPHFTASLAAAVGLVEKMLGEDDALEILAEVATEVAEDTVNGTLRDLPRHLCLALLKALSAQEKRNG